MSKGGDVGTTTLTYVVEVVGHGYIKIGKTTDLYARLNTIQNGCPYEVRLIARLRGDVESMLHAALVDQRVRGEWFVYNDKAKRVIALFDQYELGEVP